MTAFALVITLALAVLAVPVTAEAQRAGKVGRIGMLIEAVRVADTVGAHPRTQLVGAFLDGLREFGYVEGQNVVIERRSAEGRRERLPALAAELVHLKVDVIVATSTAGVRAAKNATDAIPIVMVGLGDPVGTGVVSSLAHPGGNVTGLSTLNVELTAKRLELLKEALPKASRMAVLMNPGAPVHPPMLRVAQAAARSLGVQLQSLEAATPDGIDRAFAAALASRADALLVFDDPSFFTHIDRMADAAARSRLPVMYGLREYPGVGGLMSYGPNFPDIFRRAATYVDKILKGTKPADLPVEQPTKLELVINLKTARALGLTSRSPFSCGLMR